MEISKRLQRQMKEMDDDDDEVEQEAGGSREEFLR